MVARRGYVSPRSPPITPGNGKRSMILITGGAGFIGSNLHAALVVRGHAPVVVDWLGQGQKWRNLERHPPARIIRPEALHDFLEDRPPIEAVFHLGANSDTTATDGDAVWATNVELSVKLWRWCRQHQVRFIYASSAATYGDGAQGFDDDPALLPALRPQSLYAWTKHAFDLHVTRAKSHPPQWAGLKFFNVYGPNEYHKGSMVSVVRVKYGELSGGEPARLFRSARPDVPDGGQKRDFIHVKDAVAVMLWLLEHPAVSGIFNVGTGTARSYLDLVNAVADAAGVERRVEFVDMPERLSGQYQYLTEARMDRLRQAGYDTQFTPLEQGIQSYVREHLAGPELYV